MKSKKHFLFLIILLSFAGCTSLHYSIKRDFDFSKIRKIAVVGIEDFPGFSGSGEIVMGQAVLVLVDSYYEIIERSKLKILFKEHKLAISGLIDRNTIRNIGKISGADSVITGSIIDYSPKGIIKVPVEIFEVGGETLSYYYDSNQKKTIPVKVKGADRMSKTVEIRIIDASFGLNIRMIDVESGMVIWGGSYSYNSLNITHSIARVMDKIFKTLPSAKSR